MKLSSTTIITPEYLEQLAKSVKESEAYQRTLREAKEHFAKNKEALIKAGFISK